MSKILKDDVTVDSFKTKVEAILERLEAYKDKPEFNLEVLNNDLEKIALSNRPSLDELIKRDLLEELSYQIDDPQSSFNQSDEVFDTLALDNEFEFSHVLEDYTIDRGNINRGDLKIIYNNLAEELGHDEYYPEREIADDISMARGTNNKEVALDDIDI